MIFITFPRSGVNFLSKCIELKSNVRIKYKHETYSDENIVLNIVRDPKESFTSWIALRDSNSTDNKEIDSLINKYAKNTYIEMYRFLLSRDTIFINYKDLSEIDKLIETISEILKIPCDTRPIDLNQIKSHNTPGSYYSTSKNNLKYEKYKEYIDNMDLSECYDLYHKALERCIKI